MTLDQKITLKGILRRYDVPACHLINATAKDMCYWFGQCCGYDIRKRYKYVERRRGAKP